MRAFVPTVVAIIIAAVLALPSAGLAAEAPAGAATLILDIEPAASSEPWDLTRVGGLVFFSAIDGSHGRELWVTDGTADGTRLVKDVRPGMAASSPRSLTKVGSRVYFSAHDGSHGRELWVSDGTVAGTRLVKDLNKGAASTVIDGITDVAGKAYFDQGHRGLWRTDGTPSGTRLVRSFQAVNAVDTATKGSTLFFGADGALWKTDGTSAGTKRLTTTDMSIGRLQRFKGRVYFAAVPWSAQGLEPPPRLWRSDGSKAGTRPLGDVQDPADLTVMGDGLYFNAVKTGGSAHRLFRSDGTVSGTAPVTPRVRPFPAMVKDAGRLWTNNSLAPHFEPDGLWTSDGTSAGTRLVHGGHRDWYTSDEDGLVCAGLDGLLYFAAGPGGPASDWESVDTELWVSDGTADGTIEVADIDPDGSSQPRELVRLGQSVLFTANDGEHGRELWRFDP